MSYLRVLFFTIICLLSLLSLQEAEAYKLTPFIPKDNPTGTGVIVCPGGSYFWLDKKGEGTSVAQWLNKQGIAAFVLEYSHGGWAAFAFHIRTSGRKFPAGFNDLKRALEQVKKHAAEYHVNYKHIGCMGFSAGGHLVMHAAEQLADNAQLAPFFVASIYPVVSMTHSCTHKRSRRGLLGEFPTKKMKDSLSLENHVPYNCPPVFLVNCDDDPIVHPHNAELLDSALTIHNVLHHYEHYRTGGHGFGVTTYKTTNEAIQWKDQFIQWLYKLNFKE